MQRNLTANELYELAIKNGNLNFALLHVDSVDFSNFDHRALLAYILTEATYDDATKKEIVLFISQIDPGSFLVFSDSLDFPELQKFMEICVDVNVNNDGGTLLHLQLGKSSYLDRTQLLIDNGVDVNSLEHQNGWGTFLHVLLANENFTDVSKLLDYIKTSPQKNNFHLRDSEGKTLLLLAVKVMAYTPVKKILEEDSSSLEIPDNEGRTPLHIACALGDCAIVELLIRAGARLDARDKLGNTPVHYAAMNIDKVKIILSSISIDPERDMFATFNALRDDDYSPFNVTSEVARSFKFRLTSSPTPRSIINKQVQPLACVENKKIFTAYNYFDESLKSVAYLKKFMRSFSGKTIAEDCVAGHLAVIKMLIRYSADVSLQNDAGLTPKQTTSDTDIVACLEEAEPAARFHRLQTWCLSFANSTRSSTKRATIEPMQADEPTDNWRFYQL